MKWFSVAKYREEDVHSRDYLKFKFCVVRPNGFSRRGLRIDRWVDVRATSAQDAKDRARRGEGIQRS